MINACTTHECRMAGLKLNHIASSHCILCVKFNGSVCMSFLPDAFVVSGIIKAEEDICVLTDAVVREALEVQGEVVRHRGTGGFTVTLTGFSLNEVINQLVVNELPND